MPIELEKDRELGTYKEFSAKVENRGFLKRVPTGLLKKELKTRENDDPIFILLGRIIDEAAQREISLEPDRFLYELTHDVLGRPNVYLGYNTSDFTLEEIVEQDRKIKKREIPPREENPIIWTNLLVVYDGVLRRYAGGGDKEKDLEEWVIKPFIEGISGIMNKK